MFGSVKKKIKEEVTTVEEAEIQSKKIKIMDRPKIFCIDIEDEDVSILESSGFNMEKGTLGEKVKIPNKKRNDIHFVLPNDVLVDNLHEFDITLIDLDNFKTIFYIREDHKRENHTGNIEHMLLSEFPETLFNPRAFGSSSLNTALDKLGNKKHLILNFTTDSHDIEYNYGKITSRGWSENGNDTLNIYSFCDFTPLGENKNGKDIVICDVNEELKKLLTSYKNKFTYNQTFYHPETWIGRNRVLDNDYLPLIKNLNGDIVSMLIIKDNKTIFHFPQIKNKGKFLNDFLTTVAPKLLPELFPSLTTFQWKNDKEYWLPNHEKLLQEKEQLEIEYKKRLLKKEKQIEKNLDKYQFLQQLITETGDNLVIALIKYFKWLGFEDIKVFALYIVNHQRYLPPHSRKNPPFTPHQIEDAKHDERGLVTTWQLYNLYFDIEKGLITKDEAKKLLLEYGLVDFKPQNLLYIDTTKEIFSKGKICIVNIENIKLNVGDILFFEKNDKYQKVIILDIQLNGSSVESVNNGELGLKLSEAIKKNSKVYKQEL